MASFSEPAVLAIERRVDGNNSLLSRQSLALPTVALDLSDNNFNCTQIKPYTRPEGETLGDSVLFTVAGKPVVCSPSCRIFNTASRTWEEVMMPLAALQVSKYSPLTH